MAGGKDKRQNHLTGKQEKFARLVAEGEMPQYAAYIEAYGAGRQTIESLTVKASALAATINVGERIRELRDKAARGTGITLESSLERLEALANMSVAAKNMGAAVRAEELRGKLIGLYVERTKDETVDPKAALAELCAESPELKALLWPIIFGEPPPSDEDQPVTH